MKVEITFAIVESIPFLLYKVECYLIVLARIPSSTEDCEETIEIVGYRLPCVYFSIYKYVIATLPNDQRPDDILANVQLNASLEEKKICTFAQDHDSVSSTPCEFCSLT